MHNPLRVGQAESATLALSAFPRPLGQAVKTPPFHGGNTGSNPVGVIQKTHKRYSLVSFFIFIISVICFLHAQFVVYDVHHVPKNQ